MSDCQDELVSSWLAQGFYQEVNGFRLFVVDTARTTTSSNSKLGKPVLCILHGFPTSSFDYAKVLPILTQHFRVIIHDHLGFGASDKPQDYSYSLIEQTDNAIALWKALGINKAQVLAHDYGTSIATELMVRQQQESLPFTIDSFVLSNGSVHIELAQLRLIQRLLRHKLLGPLVARLSSYSTFKRNLRNVFFDTKHLSEQEIQAHWQLTLKNKGRLRLAQISHYTREREKFWFRWIGAVKNASVPIDLVWADKDPVAVSAIAEKLHEEAPIGELNWLKECGHFPMIEQPQAWTHLVLECLKNRLS